MKRARVGLAIVGTILIGFSANASQSRDEAYLAEQHLEAIELGAEVRIDYAIIRCLRNNSERNATACAQVTAYYAIKEAGTHEPSE